MRPRAAKESGATTTQESVSPGWKREPRIRSELLEDLVGSWSTRATTKWGPGRSESTFSRDVGGTVLRQEYRMRLGEGTRAPTAYGLGLYKTSEDGSVVYVWWFDDMSAEPMYASGPLSKDRLEVRGTAAQGGDFTVTFERTGSGFTYTMRHGDVVLMTERYSRRAGRTTRAKAPSRVARTAGRARTARAARATPRRSRVSRRGR